MSDPIEKPRRPLRVLGSAASAPKKGREGEQRIDTAAQGKPGSRPVATAVGPGRRFVLWFSPVRDGVPALLLAVTTSTGGCYLSHELSPSDAGVIRDAARDAGRDAGLDAGFDAGIPWCDPFGIVSTFTVPLPSIGVVAEPAPICAEPGMLVTSGQAARVVLDLSADRRTAAGTITVVGSLSGQVVGLPRLVVVAAEPPFDAAMFGPVRRDGALYRFDVTFPSPIEMPMPDFAPRMLQLDTQFEVSCEGGDLKTVAATTFVNLCHEEDGGPTFVSSGEECRTCAIIAEMAPTPIIPMESPDALPLQQAIHLKLRPVARFEKAVLLWAEHDGEGEARHGWRNSGGTLHPIADDVVVWRPAESDATQIVQVVVETRNAAAVATFRRGAGL